MTRTSSVRPATAADIPACARIGDVPELPELHGASAERAEQYLRDYLANGIFLVAGEGPEGFLLAERTLGNNVWLEALAVAPEARRSGVGRALIEELRRIVHAKGEHLFFASAENEGTLAFYRALGFEEGERLVAFRERFGE